MSVEVIDIIRPKNGGKFPVADSNEIRGGYYQVNNIEERDSIPQERRKEGMLCFVLNDGEKENVTYQLLGSLDNSSWQEQKINNNSGGENPTPNPNPNPNPGCNCEGISDEVKKMFSKEITKYINML